MNDFTLTTAEANKNIDTKIKKQHNHINTRR
jgi:hypothetical protein